LGILDFNPLTKEINVSHSSQTELMSVAINAANAAGELIRSGYSKKEIELAIRHKGEVDLVTAVDLAAERCIIKCIKNTYEEHAILAEEGGQTGHSNAPYEWIIDPLDGTTNFSHGVPHCAVSIACLSQGNPLIGVVYDPTRDEMFTAISGEQAQLNGDSIAVSTQKEMTKSLLSTGFAYDRREKPHFYIPVFQQFMCRAQGIRRMGAAALDLAWTACGRYDGFWEANLNSWDVAAGLLIVEAAGGMVSDYRGIPVDIKSPERIVASNQLIHNEMLSVLENFE
jgi:myo-inositol-1(or 4)-monophosphatase